MDNMFNKAETMDKLTGLIKDYFYNKYKTDVISRCMSFGDADENEGFIESASKQFEIDKQIKELLYIMRKNEQTITLEDTEQLIEACEYSSNKFDYLVVAISITNTKVTADIAEYVLWYAGKIKLNSEQYKNIIYLLSKLGDDLSDGNSHKLTIAMSELFR